MTIGKNIRKLRTAAGLTQDQLAERLFVTRQTVSNWERGTSRPDVDQLEAIAGALGTEMTVLLYGEKPPRSPVSRRRFAVTALLLALTMILWAAGARVLGPLIKGYVGSSYNWGAMMLFRGGYQTAAALLLGSGVLSLMGLRWDLSLGKRGRRASRIAAGLLLAETGYNILAAVYVGRFFGGGTLGPLLGPAVWLTRKEICVPLGMVCGAGLFLAVNPPGKAV